MAQILVDPDVLDTNATNLDNLGTEVNEAVQKINQLIEAMKDGYKGHKANVFFDTFENLRPSFMSIPETIEELSQSLKNQANIWREMDAQ